jgi:hypothetical protein
MTGRSVAEIARTIGWAEEDARALLEQEARRGTAERGADGRWRPTEKLLARERAFAELPRFDRQPPRRR